MKSAKPFLIFLVFVILAGAILSAVLPASQQLEKTITINAPASVVYAQLASLERFNAWSVWSRGDSSAIYTLQGTDGTPGASSHWKGAPEISGEGSITITALQPNESVSHTLQFTSPRKAKALSSFRLSENQGLTTVTWHFEMKTARPWNIFNLFYSMDKEMGKDFEKGLLALKEIAEANSGNAPQQSYAVMTMDFPATRFAMIRQQVKWADISSYFSPHLAILQQEASRNTISAGSPTGLYFVWDEKNQQTDMAAAVPVPAGTTLSDPLIRMEDIPASKAIYVTYTGGYEKIEAAHNSLDKYLAEKKWTAKSPVIEQYISGPANEKDTAKWLTKIVYLVD